MGKTQKTGYLQNIVSYDASGNVILPANLTVLGTITGYATSSSLTGYVTLSTLQTITGIKTFSNEALFGNGITITDGYISINSGSNIVTLDSAVLTANRAILLPDASGTIALTSDIPSLTGYATESYVSTAVSNLVNSAPAALDTLSELATALGNDANFATTIATSIGTKEPAITAGTTAQYWRGDKTWQTLPTYTLSGLGGVPTSRTLTINGVAYDLTADRSWSIAAGVTSFNTRTGAITLSSSDVTTALGYTPYNSTNPNGYITSASWSSITSTWRENYDLKFRPSNDSGSYAGFSFSKPGSTSEDGGYLLIRGGSDNDVYTQYGITLVSDGGWLTLAQRTTANRGVRIMTGTTSATRISVTDSSTTINNTLTLASLASNDGQIENNTGGYFHLGGWGVSRTHSTAILVNTAYWADNAGNADTVDSIHGTSFVRNDTTSQYLKPFYEYGNYLTTQSPADLKNQMGGGGLRVDFMHPSYAGGGSWNHVITWSGYQAYNMYQLGGYYDGGTSTNLYVRSEANHGNTSWTSWRRLLNETADPYAANMNQYVRTSDGPTFADVYTTGWFRNHTNTNGIYWSTTGWHLMPHNSSDFRIHSGASDCSLRMERNGTVGGYIHCASDNAIGFLTPSRSWSLRVDSSGNTTSYGFLTANGGMRVNANDDIYIDYNHGCSIVGVYSSTRFQGVYSMGNAYKLARDGTTPGNLYGISWGHPNAGGQAGYLNDHGMMVMVNGTTYAAISSNIWARGNITANGGVYANDWLRAVGGTGVYWQSYDRGIRAADNQLSYGSICTYGSGLNGYFGYGTYDNAGYRSYFMWNNGSGGNYMQDRGKWQIYYAGSNDCVGITGSETYDWVKATTNGKHRITNDTWCDATSWAYTFSNISDGRLKENIVTVDSALDKVLQLRGVYYNWIIDIENTKHIGLIAQETAAVCPEVVNYHEETDTYSVNYSELSGLFVESTKELNQKLLEANAKIELLESKLNQLLNG